MIFAIRQDCMRPQGFSLSLAQNLAGMRSTIKRFVPVGAKDFELG